MSNLNKIITASLIFFFLVLHTIDSYSQNTTKLDSIQGIWYIIYPGDPEGTENNYIIYKDIKSLVIYSDTKDTSYFSVDEGYQGFVDFSNNDQNDNNDLIDVSLLRSNGKRFTFISKSGVKNNKVAIKDCIFPSYFEMEDSRIEMGSSGTAIYSKVPYLSNILITKINNASKHDKRNYLKEYLDIKVAEIKVAKCIIYSKPNQATKMYLIKGDVPTVLEEQKEWLKIEWRKDNDDTIIGWIKKTDTVQ